MRNVAFMILATLVLLGPLAACDGNSGGGINAGTIDMGVDAGDLTSSAFAACDSLGCDGDLGDAELRGDSGGDAYALFNLLWRRFFDQYTFEGILGTDAYANALAAIPDGVERVLTFLVNDSIPCDEGSAELSGSLSDLFDNSGFTDGGNFSENLRIVFLNCMLAADLLDNGGTHSITLSGSVTSTYYDPAELSAANPERGRLTGTVFLDTEVTAVAPASRGVGLNDSFWTDVVHFNANISYDGETDAFNGGACAGEVVVFGSDPEDDSDDECAADTDGVNDAFIATTQLFPE